MLNITQYTYFIPAILVALTIHEFSHGFAAYLLGDPTPKHQGRLTLNPLAHLDPLGTLMLLVARFGWAKPVQINPFNFRGNRQFGLLLVSLAGPASNMVVALLGGILYNLVDVYSYAWYFAISLVTINVYLAIFNLLPIPPLDGSKILLGLLPRRFHESIYKLEAYGPFILIILIVSNITGRVLIPIANVFIVYFVEIGQMLTGI